VARGNGVRIRAADGSALGGAVALGAPTIAGEQRPWLFMHPPSSVELRLDVPPRTVFQAGLGIDPAAWGQPDEGGVRFLVEVDDGRGPQALLSATLRPGVDAADRGWRFAQVDLGAYAGRRVTLVLRTEAVDTPFFDWGGWATPMVYVDRSARYPPPTGVSAVPHPHAAT
jgi:hypothetical protein